jgi:hypothetical protein
MENDRLSLGGKAVVFYSCITGLSVSGEDYFPRPQ